MLAAGLKGAFTAGSKVVKGAARMAANAPGTTAMTIIPLGLMAGSGMKDPKKIKAEGDIGRASARMMGKRAMNEVISQEDLDLYLRVRKSMEKSAAPRPRAVTAQQVRSIVDDALKQQRDLIKKQRPKMPDKGDMRVGGKHGWSYPQIALAGLILGGAGAAAGLTGSAVSAGAGKGSELIHRMGRKRHYDAMMKADPELKQYSGKEVGKIFGVLHRASPYVSKEPLLAASTVRSILDSPRATHGSKTPTVSTDAVKRVLDLETGRQGTRYPFMQELKSAPTAMGTKAHEILG